ncbi:GNAT family N-acetyltransferase [Oricola sp.]|uniref:GNAT family N-acetyltransferase n=1 Tax=Oricola sp. TaxID=1979950 RepID=UPI0025DBAAAD|nr:GNAT family N-acetyltransferase [Oricola sp.]MCI5075531.1 GNAT family N-acetyltransferase [Oricola sp.]
MSQLTIETRPAASRDAAQIAEVHSQSWYSAYAGLIPHKALRRMIVRRHSGWWKRAIERGTSVMVVDFAGTIAGYCTFGLNRARALPQEGEIYELYIRPEYQGIGVGTRLFSAARDDLKAHGCDGLVIWALEDNTMAMNFYAGHGGKDIAQGFETFEGRQLRKIAWVWQ